MHVADTGRIAAMLEDKHGIPAQGGSSPKPFIQLGVVPNKDQWKTIRVVMDTLRAIGWRIQWRLKDDSPLAMLTEADLPDLADRLEKEIDGGSLENATGWAATVRVQGDHLVVEIETPSKEQEIRAYVDRFLEQFENPPQVIFPPF